MLHNQTLYKTPSAPPLARKIIHYIHALGYSNLTITNQHRITDRSHVLVFMGAEYAFDWMDCDTGSSKA